jgi:hypothetical protein
MPPISLAKWAIGFFAILIASSGVFVVLAAANAGEWDAESFFDPLLPAVLVLVGAISAVGATAAGIGAIVGQHERSTAVLVMTVLSGFATFFFIAELLSVIGVLPQH